MTACAHCDRTIPAPSGRRSRQRYCSDTCRKAAWRERRRAEPDPNDIVPDVPDIVPDVPDVVTDSVFVTTASRDAVATPGGQHRCPHCRQPLAVISVIVPAAAAHIATPEVIHISPS